MRLKVSLFRVCNSSPIARGPFKYQNRNKKVKEIPSHLGNIWMSRVVIYVCVFLCAYVFCFTLKDWLHCQPIWGKTQFKSLKLHIRGIAAPPQTQRSCSCWAMLCHHISGKRNNWKDVNFLTIHCSTPMRPKAPKK